VGHGPCYTFIVELEIYDAPMDLQWPRYFVVTAKELIVENRDRWPTPELLKLGWR
jgi:hypothetical protein